MKWRNRLKLRTMPSDATQTFTGTGYSDFITLGWKVGHKTSFFHPRTGVTEMGVVIGVTPTSLSVRPSINVRRRTGKLFIV